MAFSTEASEEKANPKALNLLMYVLFREKIKVKFQNPKGKKSVES